MAAGTAIVTAAKRTLGRAHTFTGQCLKNPRLVTWGVYALTRNPLYLGVLLTEIGAAAIAAHQTPDYWPNGYPYAWTAMAALLAFASAFNWTMAAREARYLERCFGDSYRRYSARVPFFIPFIGSTRRPS